MVFEGFESDLIGVGEASVFVRYGGAGLPVLLLHGHPRTSATWHRVAPLLREQGFTVVCADLRGYGRSRGPVPAADQSGYSKRAVASSLKSSRDVDGIAASVRPHEVEDADQASSFIDREYDEPEVADVRDPPSRHSGRRA
jgi:pimeloyl-ACP methyl ester carboxylesterase